MKPDNDYGTIMSDLIKPFFYRTQLFQYERDDQCMQFSNSVIQTNIHDRIRPSKSLTDIESELRGQTRIYSRHPNSRYPNPQYDNPKFQTLTRPVHALLTNELPCSPSNRIVVNDHLRNFQIQMGN